MRLSKCSVSGVMAGAIGREQRVFLVCYWGFRTLLNGGAAVLRGDAAGVSVTWCGETGARNRWWCWCDTRCVTGVVRRR